MHLSKCSALRLICKILSLHAEKEPIENPRQKLKFYMYIAV